MSGLSTAQTRKLAALTDAFLREHAHDNARELADLVGCHESSIRHLYVARGIARAQRRKRWAHVYANCTRCPHLAACQPQVAAGGLAWCELEEPNELERVSQREQREARGV
jgi:hypothetical protein